MRIDSRTCVRRRNPCECEPCVSPPRLIPRGSPSFPFLLLRPRTPSFWPRAAFCHMIRNVEARVPEVDVSFALLNKVSNHVRSMNYFAVWIGPAWIREAELRRRSSGAVRPEC
jgi:hypothetical protein